MFFSIQQNCLKFDTAGGKMDDITVIVAQVNRVVIPDDEVGVGVWICSTWREFNIILPRFFNSLDNIYGVWCLQGGAIEQEKGSEQQGSAAAVASA